MTSESEEKMRPDQFVHLHVHTEYSLLDGACRIDKLIIRVKELGQPAVAITDHGNMYGAIEFWKKATAAGIKPIIGCEVYVAPRSRFDKEAKIDNKPYHLILLCENNEGYSNLVKLVSAAELEGFYSKPRVDKELLKKYHNGLICLSGCIAGEIPRLLRRGETGLAKTTAAEYQKIFGKNNYYIEIQNHDLEEEKAVLPQLFELSQDLGIPLAATNDCHYILSQDAELQDVLLHIQTGKTLGDPDALSFETKEFFVKSADEMLKLFGGREEPLINTWRIAERCNVQLEFGNIKLPKFTMEGVTDNREYFRKICYEGLYRNYGTSPDSKIIDRLEYEISVIEKMGYVDYFLIVQDFIGFARKNNIPVGPGRGSGAGSLCAYCIGITGIDPMRFGLLFERFLNPERVSMPDFDIDFCIINRDRVKDYVVEKYGADKVSDIIAFDTLKAKAAIRDVGRVLGISYQLCDKVAKMIDGRSTLADELKTNEDLSAIYRSDRSVRRLIDLSIGIEGMPRHTSTHAAGVVISAFPLNEIVPLRLNDGAVETQYPAPILEEIGLLKFDLLSLRNLTIINEAVESIRRKKPDFDINSVPTDDPAIYKMLSKGDTMGVFQFESAGITQCLMDIQPTKLEEIIVVLGLYRPGPMKSIPVYIANKNHPEHIQFLHPLLKDILMETYGVMVYQEQVMEICRKLAGYSYGHADVVRRAMSKKKHEVMLKERESFVSGALKNGVPKEIADKVFDDMVSFASYAFNKSHAAAYGYLAYQTAYLKYYYRGEYMAATMSSVMSNTAKLAEYISDCRSAGIEIVPPNINRSLTGFFYENGKMYFGLMGIKGVGSGLCQKILFERRKSGDFTGLQDFCERVEGRELNKKALESLIKAGAFDGLGLNRRQMLENYEMLLDAAGESSKGMMEGQLDLFGGAESDKVRIRIPFKEELDSKRLLALEKEATGMYISGSPLDEYGYLKKLMHLQTISEVLSEERYKDGDNVRLMCIVQSKKIHITKKGDRMCFLTLSDGSGEIDAIIFPDLFAVSGHATTEEGIVVISGRISVKDEERSIVCGAVFSERDFPVMLQRQFLCIKTTSDKVGITPDLYAIGARSPGKTRICFYAEDIKKKLIPKQALSISVTADSFEELKKLFGADKIGLIDPK